MGTCRTLRGRRWTRSLAFAVLVVQLLFSGFAAGEEGVWSKHSVLLPANAPFRVLAPDRRRAVFVEGKSLTVLEAGQRLEGLEGYSLLGRSEIGWSPDSKAFFLTASEQSAEGPWYVVLFTIENGRVALNEPFENIFARMHDRYPCLGTTDPDMGAVQWIKDSTEILIAAQVPKRSACPDRGALRGFVLRASSGEIKREFDEEHLRETFSNHLGGRIAE